MCREAASPLRQACSIGCRDLVAQLYFPVFSVGARFPTCFSRPS